jgi:hypothetical protein
MKFRIANCRFARRRRQDWREEIRSCCERGTPPFGSRKPFGRGVKFRRTGRRTRGLGARASCSRNAHGVIVARPPGATHAAARPHRRRKGPVAQPGRADRPSAAAAISAGGSPKSLRRSDRPAKSARAQCIGWRARFRGAFSTRRSCRTRARWRAHKRLSPMQASLPPSPPRPSPRSSPSPST